MGNYYPLLRDQNSQGNVGVEDYGTTARSISPPPTKNETMHMRPTNNFEAITEAEFNKREQAKNDYRRELMAQMQEAQSKKDNMKKDDMLYGIQQEKRIYRQL